MQYMPNRLIKNIMRIIWFRKPVKYAKWIGVTIGNDCKIINHPDWSSEPYLISIGNHTEISFGVSFLTHDGATWISRNDKKYINNEILKFGCIKIGNDCFIGCRSIILPNVTIGDKVIIAAGSVVTKSVPSGEVWGGVPARKIMDSEEYLQKCAESNKIDTVKLKKNKRKELERVFSKYLL